LRVYLVSSGEEGWQQTSLTWMLRCFADAESRVSLESQHKFPLRMLFSYHYFRDANLESLLASKKREDLDIFADSGAYSAWTTGHPITVPEYAAWLEKWGDRLTCAAALDVIGDAEGSYKQTTELVKIVRQSHPKLPILPVFHANDTGGFYWLERYIAEGYDYIGIAPNAFRFNGQNGLVGPWLQRCMELAQPTTRYHGLGMTTWKHLTRFPLYSVDSTTWTNFARYGATNLMDSPRGRLQHVILREPPDRLRYRDLLTRYGLNVANSAPDEENMERLTAAAMVSWREAEVFLTRLNTRRKS
jgi:hypothetical protein